MTARLRRLTASRDDIRAAYKEAKREATGPRKTPKLRPSSLRRLNWLRDHHFKADDQSMAIDLACLRLTGSLEPWKEAK